MIEASRTYKLIGRIVYTTSFPYWNRCNWISLWFLTNEYPFRKGTLLALRVLRGTGNERIESQRIRKDMVSFSVTNDEAKGIHTKGTDWFRGWRTLQRNNLERDAQLLKRSYSVFACILTVIGSHSRRGGESGENGRHNRGGFHFWKPFSRWRNLME